METFKLGELFCGPGGIACGALRAKAKTAYLQLNMLGPMIMTRIHVKHIAKTFVPNLPKQFIVVMCVNWILRSWVKLQHSVTDFLAIVFPT